VRQQSVCSNDVVRSRVSTFTLKVLHIKYENVVAFYGNNAVLVIIVTCLVTQKRRNKKIAKACAMRVCIVCKLYCSLRDCADDTSSHIQTKTAASS